MDFISKEKPKFASLALDGWSVHSHGYMGAITSNCHHNKLSIDLCNLQTTSPLNGDDRHWSLAACLSLSTTARATSLTGSPSS